MSAALTAPSASRPAGSARPPGPPGPPGPPSGGTPVGPRPRASRRLRAAAEFLYLLVGVPLGALGFGYAVLTLLLSVITGITSLGMPLLSASVRGARRLGGLHRGLARGLLGLTVSPPRPLPRGHGFLSWTAAGIRDAAGWRAMAYLVLKLPVAVVTFAAAGAFWGYGLFFTSHLGWWWLVPDGQRMAVPNFDWEIDTWGRALVLAAVGLVLLLAAPWVTRGVLVLDRVPLRGLLGPTTLSERVRDLEEARSHAVEDAAAKLRRIERDLHDGTQARLVALAMKLGMAKESLDAEDGRADLDQARLLVDHAHRGLKETLAELRDLVRGIHPAVLDSGLEPALATLAGDCAVPVRLRVSVPDRPSAAIETIAYFCVAELLTNVVKHSRARLATVDVEQRGGVLRVRVADDGVGGAVVGSVVVGGAVVGGADPHTVGVTGGDGTGSGLAGLTDRVRTVDGRIEVDSPPGGPTVVTVELPSHT
ncbi:sensor histidine kinase [Streptoalloteichus tenebrarius]|uniref:sensor histidine kinase n=1 Tax=Streptoalloteichus tenebrarius (strain ATCC 17920 / DSM 40477 / JCM 4838 / CBS 697.72 / NBRC 16177 / NCIMB 11028 / NRRL B-12390 / A12253. 1 / ISP 5477) TaxID=1933 RepID=UPI0035F09712